LTSGEANQPQTFDASEFQRAVEFAGDLHPGFNNLAPENNLQPDPARLAFDLRILTERVDRIAALLRIIFGGKNGA
jgi:hypothetical protein